MVDILRRHEPQMDFDADTPVYHPADAHNQSEHDDYGIADYDDGYGEYRKMGIFDRMLKAPMKTGVFVATFAGFIAVAANAAFLQPGVHPSPLAHMRDAVAQNPIQFDAAPRADRLPVLASEGTQPPDRTVSTASIPEQVPNPTLFDAPAPAITTGRVVPPSPVPRPANLGSVTMLAQPAAEPPRQITPQDQIAALLSAPPVPPVRVPVPQQQAPGLTPVVAAVQQVLAELGYAPGTIDGVMGPGTEEAIRRFQLRRALEPNGQITSDLLREIERVTGESMTRS